MLKQGLAEVRSQAIGVTIQQRLDQLSAFSQAQIKLIVAPAALKLVDERFKWVALTVSGQGDIGGAIRAHNQDALALNLTPPNERAD